MREGNDYSEALDCLRRVVGTLDEARLMAGRANLPSIVSPQSVSSQIDAVDDLIALAQIEIDAARQACAVPGRVQFRVIK
ncbi:MAG: hypothetical protein AAF557_20620 [Pseudomonadota bacterium]